MQRKNGFLLAGLFIVAIVLLVLSISLHKSGNVTLLMSPSAATASVNGKSVNPGSFYLKPGKYTVKAAMNGFASNTKDFTVPSSNSVKVILVLNPNSQVGLDWLKNHPDDNSLYQSTVQNQAVQESKQQVSKLPLISELPHIDNFYRVDYGKSALHPDDPTAVALYITFYSADGKQQALQWLQFKGYDPSRLEIIYTDKTADAFN